MINSKFSLLTSFPVECIKKMDEIAKTVEATIKYWKRFQAKEVSKENFEFIIDHAMIMTALSIDGIHKYKAYIWILLASTIINRI